MHIEICGFTLWDKLLQKVEDLRNMMPIWPLNTSCGVIFIIHVKSLENLFDLFLMMYECEISPINERYGIFSEDLEPISRPVSYEDLLAWSMCMYSGEKTIHEEFMEYIHKVKG